MFAALLVKRWVRFAFRAIAVPALVGSLALGAVSGPHGIAAHLTPQPAMVIQELQTHHDVPKGTTLTLGDPNKPFVVAYDTKGRVQISPPKGETFGMIAMRGFSQIGTLAQQATSALRPARTNVAAAQTVTKQ